MLPVAWSRYQKARGALTKSPEVASTSPSFNSKRRHVVFCFFVLHRQRLFPKQQTHSICRFPQASHQKTGLRTEQSTSLHRSKLPFLDDFFPFRSGLIIREQIEVSAPRFRQLPYTLDPSKFGKFGWVSITWGNWSLNCSALILGYFDGLFGFGFRWGIEEPCSFISLSLSLPLSPHIYIRRMPRAFNYILMGS